MQLIPHRQTDPALPHYTFRLRPLILFWLRDPWRQKWQIVPLRCLSVERTGGPAVSVLNTKQSDGCQWGESGGTCGDSQYLPSLWREDIVVQGVLSYGADHLSALIAFKDKQITSYWLPIIPLNCSLMWNADSAAPRFTRPSPLCIQTIRHNYLMFYFKCHTTLAPSCSPWRCLVPWA